MLKPRACGGGDFSHGERRSGGRRPGRRRWDIGDDSRKVRDEATLTVLHSDVGGGLEGVDQAAGFGERQVFGAGDAEIGAEQPGQVGALAAIALPCL